MVYPVIPIFITVVLGAPAVALGMIEGTAEAIVSFMKGWSGWHSDKSGKRTPYIRAGYGLSAIGKPILGLAFAWPVVLLARVTDRLGKGLRTTARDALIADSVDKSQYGAAFGLHRALDTAGALVGGLVAIGLLMLLPGQLRLIFLIATLPGIGSVVLTFLVREGEAPPKPDAKATAIGTLRQLGPGYWRAVVLTLLFGLANSSDTFILLRANGLFEKTNLTWLHLDAKVGGAALVLTTLAYTLYNIAYVGCSYPAGRLSDRIGRWWVLAAGYLIYAGVYTGFSVAGAASVWVLFALYGLYSGLTNGVSKALVADHAPAHARGSALGFFYMASGFMTLLGNVIAGLLWDRVGPSATFAFGSGLALLVVTLIPLTRRWESKPV